MKLLTLFRNFLHFAGIPLHPHQNVLQIGNILCQRNVVHVGRHESDIPFFVDKVLQYHRLLLLQMQWRSKGGTNSSHDHCHLIVGKVGCFGNRVKG